MSKHSRWALVLVAVALIVGTSTTAGAGVGAKKKAGALVGLFKVDPAACTTADVTGSYFRMVAAGGTTAAGPFLPNGDSTCTDQSYSSLLPGTDGGLRTGAYQPDPTPPFDAAGNGLASAIVEPVKFFALDFAVSTNKADPQSSAAVAAPKISVSKKGALSGQVSAVSVAYGGQQFNQGSPKPDGSLPGGTSKLTGTYDKKTGKYTIEWSSQIVGGSFDGFTGVWHLEGTFKKGKK